MKKIALTLSSILLFVCADAQSSEETEIRKLEAAMKEAFLKKDTVALFKLYSPDFVVNTPHNNILTLQQLKQIIRNGEVDRDVFEKITERVTINSNIAIAMGNETLHPTGKMLNAGKIVKRRYTNIWMKTDDNWQLIARQATIISVE